MAEFGILASGAYVPIRRLQRTAIHAANAWFAPWLKGAARGERAVAHWDEDAVTMAVEAGRDCLGGRDRGSIAGVTLASTTAPFADRQNAGIVKEALNLSDDVATADYGGGLRAGLAALIDALEGRREALVIAADKRDALPGSEAEMTQGDGAAAMLVGEGAPIARLIASHRSSADFVDHYRASGEATDYGWEARWLRDEGFGKIAPPAIRAALSKVDGEVHGVKHFLFASTVKGAAAQIAKKCGFPAESVADTLGERVGDTGAAHPLLMLAHMLEKAQPGEQILLVSFGNGCDVALFERTDAAAPEGGVEPWLSRRRPDDNYMRHLAFTGHLRMERGMRAEFDQKQPLTALWRERKTVLGLVGGRAPGNGAVQFPRTRIAVNGDLSDVDGLEDHPLAEIPARILTHTADSLTYTPDPPAYYGMIAFEGGGRMVAEFCDVEEKDVVVGRKMRMMFRIKSIDETRHFTRYFWKAARAAED